MRARELRERSDEELRNLLEEAQGGYFHARVKNATHQLIDSSLIPKNRKEVARIKTILNERLRAAQKA